MTRQKPRRTEAIGRGPPMGRRRVLGIVGCAAGLAFDALPLRALASTHVTDPAFRHHWRGIVLGATATITLVHHDKAIAGDVIKGCVAEIARLERVFSLYKEDSALSRLNRDGEIPNPPADLLRLLSQSRVVSEASGGAFDPTVQPLWRLYARHFEAPGADPAGPPQRAIAAALARTGFRAVIVRPDLVRFAKSGMALTLNGIAQGYIAERVVDLLRARGVERSLVNLGELHALGKHPDGRPWRAGIADPADPEQVITAVDLIDRALATSGDYGTRFDAAGRFPHILDPVTGRPTRYHRSVTVRAPSAAFADGLSTAVFAMPEQRGLEMLASFDQTGAVIVRGNGTIAHQL